MAGTSVTLEVLSSNCGWLTISPKAISRKQRIKKCPQSFGKQPLQTTVSRLSPEWMHNQSRWTMKSGKPIYYQQIKAADRRSDNPMHKADLKFFVSPLVLQQEKQDALSGYYPAPAFNSEFFRLLPSRVFYQSGIFGKVRSG